MIFIARIVDHINTIMRVRAGDTTIEVNILVYLPDEKVAGLLNMDEQELYSEIVDLLLEKIRSGEIDIEKNEIQSLVNRQDFDDLN